MTDLNRINLKKEYKKEYLNFFNSKIFIDL
jgi:hypothetical protein